MTIDSSTPLASVLEVNRADDQTEQLDTVVNAGIITWLRELGIDPDNPPKKWKE